MRQTKEELDAAILDVAAGLFASYGLRQTSVQAIADAVGYSKAGLLFRFSSKTALQEAVLTQALRHVEALGASVDGRLPGRGRDRAVAEALVDLAQQRPGLVALILSAFTTGQDPDVVEQLDQLVTALFAAFASTRGDDLGRRVRVTSALAAVAVTVLALKDLDLEQARPHVLAACCAALWSTPSTDGTDEQGRP